MQRRVADQEGVAARVGQGGPAEQWLVLKRRQRRRVIDDIERVAALAEVAKINGREHRDVAGGEGLRQRQQREALLQREVVTPVVYAARPHVPEQEVLVHGRAEHFRGFVVERTCAARSRTFSRCSSATCITPSAAPS